ncbi:MAG: COX15/CtaA family protein [Parvularculaceae bacterium]
MLSAFDLGADGIASLDARRDHSPLAAARARRYLAVMTTAILAAPTKTAAARAASRPVAIWLFAMCALIALMVAVGGATRLTDSGLSITEWRPVTGALPPLGDAAWEAEFAKYKRIPEYREVNAGMALADFKTIYWWEWGHRQLGRFIGFAFLLPLIFFTATKRVDAALGGRLGLLFLLGGLQGAVGWWMVASGLTERVDVSQYRLAAHLGLAVALFAATLWTALDLVEPREARARVPRGVSIGAAAVALGVYLQIVLGAFVAGLRAGRSYTDWPLMDGRVVPDGYFDGPARVGALFETAAATQFNHRLGAYLLAAGALAFAYAARRTVVADRARLVAGLTLAQGVMGVLTLVNGAATPLALAHQFLAIALFATALYTAHGAPAGGPDDAMAGAPGRRSRTDLPASD